MTDHRDERPTDATAAQEFSAEAIPPRPPLPPQLPASFGLPPAPIYPAASFPATAAPQSAAPEAPRERRRGIAVVGVLVAAALVGGAAGLGGSYAGNVLWSADSANTDAGPSTITINNPDNVNTVSAVASKVTPSVVTIEASNGASGGSGSGVVLTADGYVLTNTHVVTLDGATGHPALRVTDANGRIYNATVVGTDPIYDLAVIKLEDASGLTPIEFADSDVLNVGAQTIAIGAPLGLPNTVTTGIVSYLHRSIQIASSAVPEDAQQEDSQDNGGQFEFDLPGQSSPGQNTGSISISVIQTDAAINPGNSGGALVDAEGKLIGINVAIASPGGQSSSSQAGNIGVGFAIPSNVAERIANEIIENGSATHGLLGATVISASALEGAEIGGAAIKELSAGGAAEKAGLQPGDIVTNFAGKPITSSTDLTAQVRALAGGETTQLTYVRGGKSVTVDVMLGTLK